MILAFVMWSVTDERDRLSFEFHSNWLFRNGSSTIAHMCISRIFMQLSENPAAATPSIALYSSCIVVVHPSTRYFYVMKFV